MGQGSVRVGTANIRDTLTDKQAREALEKVLTQGDPDLLGVTEWDGKMTDLPGYSMVRAAGGGSPLVFRTKRYDLTRTRTRTLVGSGRVGRLVGRKSTLPASKAATYILDDLGHTTVVIVIHLTAEVQRGKGYRRDPAHARRVARHLAERAQLKVLVRLHRRKGQRVFVVGDANYDGMGLHPLVSCWKGRHGKTLGSRAVDIVFADRAASDVLTIPTASDHDAVVATYND